MGFFEATDSIHDDMDEIDWMEDDYVAITAAGVRNNHKPLSLQGVV